MFRARFVLRCLLAGFILSISTFSSASAADHFIVEGTEITGTEEVPFVELGDSLMLETTVAKTEVVFSCEDAVSKGDFESEGKSKREIALKDCTVYELSKGKAVSLTACTVVTPIEYKDTSVLIPNYEEEMLPNGETFFTLEVTGKTCAIEGKYAVTGYEVCETPAAEFEKVFHDEICTPAGSELEVGKNTGGRFSGRGGRGGRGGGGGGGSIDIGGIAQGVGSIFQGIGNMVGNTSGRSSSNTRSSLVVTPSDELHFGNILNTKIKVGFKLIGDSGVSYTTTRITPEPAASYGIENEANCIGVLMVGGVTCEFELKLLAINSPNGRLKVTFSNGGHNIYATLFSS